MKCLVGCARPVVADEAGKCHTGIQPAHGRHEYSFFAPAGLLGAKANSAAAADKLLANCAAMRCPAMSAGPMRGPYLAPTRRM